MKRSMYKYGFLALSVILFSGCNVVLEKGRRQDLTRIRELESELAELRSAKTSLESSLSSEIGSKDVTVSMEGMGLKVTMLDSVLFDSGRAELKTSSLPVLNKIADVLKGRLSTTAINIAGHTDNVPIKHSGWKSNWELSAHRALSVLGYLERQGISARRLSATGYGEFHPVTSDDTKEGRKQNRRVEIRIMPKSIAGSAIEEQEPSSSSSESQAAGELK
jgi:chemotaxis protein MotB